MTFCGSSSRLYGAPLTGQASQRSWRWKALVAVARSTRSSPRYGPPRAAAAPPCVHACARVLSTGLTDHPVLPATTDILSWRGRILHLNGPAAGARPPVPQFSEAESGGRRLGLAEDEPVHGMGAPRLCRQPRRPASLPLSGLARAHERRRRLRGHAWRSTTTADEWWLATNMIAILAMTRVPCGHRCRTR